MLPTSCSSQLCLSRASPIQNITYFRKYWVCVLLSYTLFYISSLDITCCILYKTIPCSLSLFRMEEVLWCWHHAMAIQIMSNISLKQMRRWIYKNRWIVHKILFMVKFNITKNALFLMQPSKANLNLPTSSFHLCSPLGENCRVKIYHQFTSFSNKWGEDSSPQEKG